MFLSVLLPADSVDIIFVGMESLKNKALMSQIQPNKPKKPETGL
jgi:hypothetical protein